MPSELSDSLRKDFKGVKRTVAKGASETKDVKVSSGKHPLSFEGYKMLGNFSLKQTGTEWIFFRTMLIICWNLICRVNNGIQILYNHMEFFEDALKIYIIHQKNDQEGDQAGAVISLLCSKIGGAVMDFIGIASTWMLFKRDSGCS